MSAPSVDPERDEPAAVRSEELASASAAEAASFAEQAAMAEVTQAAVEVARAAAHVAATEELEALRRQYEALSRRLADDLRLAGKVQRGLQPGPVQHPRLDLAREFIPFREVGGDYYDVVPLGQDRVAVAIGDVMGKGIPAALLAATLTATVRSQIQAGQTAPNDVVVHVNRLFWQVSPPGLFASLFFGVLDLGAGTLDYVNAGHHYPLVLHDGVLTRLHEGGTVLGLLEDACYQGARVRLQPADLLLLYSDGIIDRSNREGELYGVERLEEAMLRSRSDPARICVYSILGEVQGWSEGMPADDDATLIVARMR